MEAPPRSPSGSRGDGTSLTSRAGWKTTRSNWAKPPQYSKASRHGVDLRAPPRTGSGTEGRGAGEGWACRHRAAYHAVLGRSPCSVCESEALLNLRPRHGNLVRMTRFRKSTSSTLTSQRRRASRPRSGYWPLQDAKARFSELVRRVRSEGPQHVTVHGRDEVVVIAAEEFRRLKGSATGNALIEAMKASPYREIELE